MPDHDHLGDDLAAYALGALETSEAERLRVHLEACDACQRQLLWLEEAVALLPRTVEQLAPPPRLRESILEAVRAEARRAAPETPPAAGRWWSGLAVALRRPAVAIAIAATLIVGGVAGYLIAGPGGSETATYRVEAVGGSAVTGVLERTGASGILRVSGMPALAPGRVYEVWVERGGALSPSSLFVPRRDHSADAAVPGDLGRADAVLVTSEPAGGSRKPSSPPLLRVPLQ